MASGRFMHWKREPAGRALLRAARELPYDTWRVVYTVRFVLRRSTCYIDFQKKSPSGVRTAMTDVDHDA